MNVASGEAQRIEVLNTISLRTVKRSQGTKLGEEAGKPNEKQSHALRLTKNSKKRPTKSAREGQQGEQARVKKRKDLQ